MVELTLAVKKKSNTTSCMNNLSLVRSAADGAENVIDIVALLLPLLHQTHDNYSKMPYPLAKPR